MNDIFRRKVHVYGGGTVTHISNHLSLSATAYGHTALALAGLAKSRFELCDTELHLTKMAGGTSLETNESIDAHLKGVIADPLTKVIFFSCAIVDWEPVHMSVRELHDITTTDTYFTFGKNVRRLQTENCLDLSILLRPAEKLIRQIREVRKDLFLVSFKTTCDACPQEMFEAGLRQCKKAHSNLVFVNDVVTRKQMIVTPEEAAYGEDKERGAALEELVEMAYYRSHLTFTQSTVISGDPVPWTDSRVPDSLRKVVEYCIEGNAYKPFLGATVGHFAVKISDTEFLTSIRRSDFNKLRETGLVFVRTDGPDTVIAYGAKPSVGGQSQRMIFRDHPGYDCVVHFHCPLRGDHRDDIPIRSQREVECGSHQCGQNTSDGLKQFGDLKAVYLDRHGPNIVFPRNINPQQVIDFITANFDLTQKTGGYNLAPT